jgi:hypothetical protein
MASALLTDFWVKAQVGTMSGTSNNAWHERSGGIGSVTLAGRLTIIGGGVMGLMRAGGRA